jgi:hypothetical protein
MDGLTNKSETSSPPGFQLSQQQLAALRQQFRAKGLEPSGADVQRYQHVLHQQMTHRAQPVQQQQPVQAAAGDRDAEPGYAAGDAQTERGLGGSGDGGAGIEALGERRRGWPPEGEEPRGEVAGLPPGAATATADGADDAPAGVPAAAAAAAATAAAAPVTTTRRFTTDLIKRRHESNHTSLSYLQERI